MSPYPALDEPLPPLWGKVGMGGDAARGFRQRALPRCASIDALPPIQLRLSSLTFAKPPQPSPTRGEGEFLGNRLGPHPIRLRSVRLATASMASSSLPTCRRSVKRPSARASAAPRVPRHAAMASVPITPFDDVRTL